MEARKIQAEEELREATFKQKNGLSPTLTLGCNQEQYLKTLAEPDPIKYFGSNQVL